MWFGPLCLIFFLFVLIIGILLYILSSKSEKYKDTSTFISKIIIVFGLIPSLFFGYQVLTFDSTELEGYHVYHSIGYSSNSSAFLLFETRNGNYTSTDIGARDNSYYNLTIHGLEPSNNTIVTLFCDNQHLSIVYISPEPVNFTFKELDWSEDYLNYELMIYTETERYGIIFRPNIIAY